MPKITFSSSQAHVIFHGMAEGMSEVAADDAAVEPAEALREQQLDALIAATPYDEAKAYPLSFELEDDLTAIAEDVRDNCLDIAVGHPDGEDLLQPGMVVIMPS
jgi:hypothetical protein